MKNEKLYKKYSKGRHWENHPTLYAEDFVRFLKKNKFNGMIVDVGCGNGRDLKIFHDAGFSVLGIDYSEKEIANARKLNPKLKFDVQNAEKMKLKSNSVQAFFCINVVHYVNQEKVVKEFLRCLKKGGHLFIHFNIKIVDKYGNLDYGQEEDKILTLLSKFEVIQRKIIERDDLTPFEHHHKILELILRKP